MSTQVHPRVQPLTRRAAGWTALEAVRIQTHHPDLGNGAIYLDPIQTEYIHARLSQIEFAFLHNIDGGTLVTTLNSCGAEALPVSRIEGDIVSLQGIVLRRGDERAYLVPEQIGEVRQQLEQIILEFLHDNGWGGEDARSQ